MQDLLLGVIESDELTLFEGVISSDRERWWWPVFRPVDVVTLGDDSCGEVELSAAAFSNDTREDGDLSYKETNRSALVLHVATRLSKKRNTTSVIFQRQKHTNTELTDICLPTQTDGNRRQKASCGKQFRVKHQYIQ